MIYRVNYERLDGTQIQIDMPGPNGALGVIEDLLIVGEDGWIPVGPITVEMIRQNKIEISLSKPIDR